MTSFEADEARYQRAIAEDDTDHPALSDLINTTVIDPSSSLEEAVRRLVQAAKL